MAGNGFAEGTKITTKADEIRSRPQQIERPLRCGVSGEGSAGRLLIGWYHSELAMGVQVVSGALFDGNSDRRRVQLVDIVEGKAVAVAPIEDLIAGRLGQHASTEAGMPDRLG